MRRSTAIFCIIAAVGMLTACQSTAKTEETTTAAAVETTAAETAKEPAEKPAPPKKEKPAEKAKPAERPVPPEKEAPAKRPDGPKDGPRERREEIAGILEGLETPGVVTGEITEAGISTITVTSEADGEVYHFSREDAEIEMEDGIVIGGGAEVIYDGVLSGTDTTGVKVVLIRDNIVKWITGTVVDEGMSTIQIETRDGRTLAFSKEMAESERADGAETGAEVTLTYTGEIFGDDTTFAFVHKIEDAGPKGGPAGPKAAAGAPDTARKDAADAAPGRVPGAAPHHDEHHIYGGKHDQC